MSAGFSFGLLGPLTAARDGVPITVSAPRQRAVLALLLLEAGRPVPAHRIVEQVWGEDAPSSALNNLQVQVSALRRALRATTRTGEDDTVLTAHHGSYVLHVPEQAVDVHRFDARVRQGRAALLRASFSEAAEVLRQALELWRGEPLEEFAGLAFADLARTRLQVERLAALTSRLDAELALGRHASVLGELRDLVSRHPEEEQLRGQLMLALYRSGRQADALRVYADGRDHVAEELGIDPGPELRRLHQQILQQDPGLEPTLGPRVTGPRRPAAVTGVPAPRGSAFELAPPLTTLVGREAEMEEAVRLLRPSSPARLVTLLGPGGSGKTRIAIEVARRLAGAFSGGVSIVPLAPIEHPSDVLPHVHRVLGLVEEPGRSLVDSLSAHLEQREVLLVLDNVEQVVDAADDLSSLLRRAGKVKVLSTSRTALRISGEHELRIRPLALPAEDEDAPAAALRSDAVRLFLERASAASGLRMTADNASAIVSVCSRLDGLPLALELAAARTKVLTPQAMLSRLERSLALLTGGSRDLPPRQRTLRATLDWSYRLLEPPDAVLLARLSLFPGGWTIEAAEAVSDGDDPDVLETLSRLLDRNLILSDGAGRFSMLRTVREYAREQLSGDEELLGWGRFADWCLDVMRQLEERRTQDRPRPPDDRLLAAFETELPNVLAAVDWLTSRQDGERLGRLVADCGALWHYSGRLSQGSRSLRQALGLALPDACRAAVLGYAASFACMADEDLRRAESLYQEALQLAARLGRPTADTRGNFAVTLRWQGRFREAAEQLALAAEEDPTDWWWSGELGELHHELGECDRAAPLVEGAYHAALGFSPTHVVRALSRLSVLQLERGDAQASLASAAEGVRLLGDAPVDPSSRVDHLLVAASVTLHWGETDLAERLLVEAGQLMLQIGYRLPLADDLSALGLVRHLRGDPVEALRARLGLVMQYRHLRHKHQECLTALRGSVERSAYERYVDEGRRASESAVELRRMVARVLLLERTPER